MNEMDTYYENTNSLSSSLSDIQRREDDAKSSAVGVKSAIDDVGISLTKAQADKEEAEGGQTTGSGLLASTAYNIVKGQVQKNVLGALKSKVQGKIDDIRQAKISSNVENKDPAPPDAVARNQPDIDFSNTPNTSELRGVQQNLQKRVGNMDAKSQQDVKDSYTDDVNTNSQPSTADDFKSLEDIVKQKEQDPNTKFQDEDMSTAEPDAVNVGTTGGRVGTNLAPPTANTTPTAPTNLGDVDAGLKSMTDEGMSQLSSKLGVEFGDLTSEDVGTALSGSLTDAGGSMLGSLGGALGTAMDYLGPLGMVAGIITTGFGISKSLKEMNQEEQKQKDIQTLASGINNLGGMSFGSIASSAMDTSQIRSGGGTSNF